MNAYSMYTHIFTYIFIYVYTDIFVFIFMYMELSVIVWKCELSEIINNNYGVAVYTNIRRLNIYIILYNKYICV